MRSDTPPDGGSRLVTRVVLCASVAFFGCSEWRRAPPPGLLLDATTDRAPAPDDNGIGSAKPAPDASDDLPGADDVPAGVACGPNLGDCDGDPANGCEAQLASDAMNCGRCANACVFAHATGVCREGGCALGACEEAWADCDGSPMNGCEVELRASASHCGRCGAACGLAGASAACDAGACAVGVCSPARASCDGDDANGCETDLNTSDAHCGRCGRGCAAPHALRRCTGGECGPLVCERGFGDCDGDAENGCEVDLSAATAHCGECRRACRDPSPRCVGGSCTAAVCTAPMADCDGMSSNGCEVDLSRDVNHCGACGRRCALTDGRATCRAGRCEVTSCTGEFFDCNGAFEDGCESDSVTDPRNCGACGRRCAFANGSGTCRLSRCQLRACEAGFDDCDEVAANGCEVNLATDARHCGACGNACALPNAVNACAAGRCGIAGCDAGFANCDGVLENGCEVELASDPRSCGACARACPDVERMVCVAGSCRCAPGTTRCGAACVDLMSDAAHCGACGNACANGRVCQGGRCQCPAGTTECERACLRCAPGQTGFCGAHPFCCGGARPFFCDHPVAHCWDARVACETAQDCGARGWRACVSPQQRVRCADDRCE